MSELGLGQAVEVRNLGVDFCAETGTAFGCTFAMCAMRGARAEDFLQQVVELRRRTNEPRGALDQQTRANQAQRSDPVSG